MLDTEGRASVLNSWASVAAGLHRPKIMIGERRAAIGQNGADAGWAGTLQIAHTMSPQAAVQL